MSLCILQAWFVIALLVGKGVVSDRVIMTTTGPLQGFTVETLGLDIESFLGIPYAEPPIRDLRFNKPVPKDPWIEILVAASLPPPCIQNVTLRRYWEPEVQNMSEDCLFLNLWVPYSKEDVELKTIIIFIHGGAFTHGAGNMPLYDGMNLARFGNVIVANFNYRVGVMGFFSALIEEANGNMGIFDQILAMRWIKDNAKAFGGDPENIVLMGESAGAVSISGHLISPLTKHLFRRVIMQSGAATLPILAEDNARLFNTSQNIAHLVGCADKQFTLTDNPRVVLQCLKNLPANVLSSAEGLMMEVNNITFFPRVGDSYLPKLAIKSLHEGHFSNVDMLIGINEEEGPFFLAASVPQFFGNSDTNRIQSVSRRFAVSLVRTIFSFTEQRNEKEIAEQYINSVENGTSDAYSKAIAMSLGDYLINCNSLFHAELHATRNPVFFYVFSRRASSKQLDEWMGVTHFDELQYVFGNPLFGNFTPQDAEFSRRMMARWIAFAKTGNPNIPGEVKWPLFTYENPEYIFLDDTESVRSRPDNYRCEFWRDRYQAQMTDQIMYRIRKSSSSGSLVTANVLNPIIMVLPILFLLCKKYIVLFIER